MGANGQSVSSRSRGMARTGKLTGTFYAARPGAAVAAADRCVANRRMQRSNAFAFGDFISFDERQKNQTQRKSLCAKGKPGCLLMKVDRQSTRLNSSHQVAYRMPSSA